MSSVIATLNFEMSVGGWRLVWRAAMVFLFPLAAAVFGARNWNASPEQQMLGALGAFAVGVGIARLIMKRVRI